MQKSYVMYTKTHWLISSPWKSWNFGAQPLFRTHPMWCELEARPWPIWISCKEPANNSVIKLQLLCSTKASWETLFLPNDWVDWASCNFGTFRNCTVRPSWASGQQRLSSWAADFYGEQLLDPQNKWFTIRFFLHSSLVLKHIPKIDPDPNHCMQGAIPFVLVVSSEMITIYSLLMHVVVRQWSFRCG